MTDKKDTIAHMTAEQMGRWFWSISVPYEELAQAQIDYDATGYDLAEVQAGWKDIETAYKIWASRTPPGQPKKLSFPSNRKVSG
jgi:hypothetical protein